jgi:electron transfer flavoprotein beta subunit
VTGVEVLVCVKRIPATGGKITLTADGRDIDTHFLGFTVSPHEECAVEEALRLSEALGGSVTVLTLGPVAAVEQLRDAMAMGAGRGVLLETDGREWDASATAGAIVDAVRAHAARGHAFDLLLFGNEAADTGDYQVGIRVARALDWPCITGIKSLTVNAGTVVARREAGRNWEVWEAPLPAVITVKEGINRPRYPSLPGRLRAKKAVIERMTPAWKDGGLTKLRLRLPAEGEHQVEVLGNGPDAAPRVVEILRRLGVAP